MSYKAGSSSAHIGGALSIAEILAALFTKKISYDSLDPLARIVIIYTSDDRLLAYYSVLHEIKYLLRMIWILLKKMNLFVRPSSNE